MGSNGFVIEHTTCSVARIVAGSFTTALSLTILVESNDLIPGSETSCNFLFTVYQFELEGCSDLVRPDCARIQFSHFSCLQCQGKCSTITTVALTERQDLHKHKIGARLSFVKVFLCPVLRTDTSLGVEGPKFLRILVHVLIRLSLGSQVECTLFCVKRCKEIVKKKSVD